LCNAACAKVSRINEFRASEYRNIGGHPNDKKHEILIGYEGGLIFKKRFNARFRHVVAFAIVAVAIAVLMRHTRGSAMTFNPGVPTDSSTAGAVRERAVILC
jgi:hypothetical protein